MPMELISLCNTLSETMSIFWETMTPDQVPLGPLQDLLQFLHVALSAHYLARVV
jgi:hypothetical protein